MARIVQDGDTIQVGYGSIPNAILGQLAEKKHLGVHTELLTDGIVDLMKRGVIDNSQKDLNRGKTVAAFSMGRRETYRYLHDNPAIEFRQVNYTNNPTARTCANAPWTSLPSLIRSSGPALSKKRSAGT